MAHKTRDTKSTVNSYRNVKFSQLSLMSKFELRISVQFL